MLPPNKDLPITIKFKQKGKIIETKVPIEDTIKNKQISLLEVAHKNKINLEGACEGNLACSTCQVYCPKDLFTYKDGELLFKENQGKLFKLSDKENDLLDKAYNVKETSRLGCQIKINKSLNNKIFEVPKATLNLAVDDFKPIIH
ncbi:hypothetical protein NUSPORA_00294 [Nucleospora cyclopteri]